jgi:hypothetical protein
MLNDKQLTLSKELRGGFMCERSDTGGKFGFQAQLMEDMAIPVVCRGKILHPSKITFM